MLTRSFIGTTDTFTKLYEFSKVSRAKGWAL
jgi:hypothetical protein